MGVNVSQKDSKLNNSDILKPQSINNSGPFIKERWDSINKTNPSVQKEEDNINKSSDINKSIPFIREFKEDSSVHGITNDTISRITIANELDNKATLINIDRLKQEKEILNKNLVPYTFIWQEYGQNVYVVGTFGNWMQRYQMKKYNHEFTLTLVSFI